MGIPGWIVSRVQVLVRLSSYIKTSPLPKNKNQKAKKLRWMGGFLSSALATVQVILFGLCLPWWLSW